MKTSDWDQETVNDFIAAAVSPRGVGHTTGTLEDAERIRSENPGLASSHIAAASVLGDWENVENLIQAGADVKSKLPPYDWDALTYLCFSRYLRIQPERTPDFVKTAKLLLNAGANANTGWYDDYGDGRKEYESAIYGAAGVAHNAEVTRNLLEYGADPNDSETPYHAPESYDNDITIALIQSCRLTDDSVATMLIRKADWHDFEGMKLIMEAGANPNALTIWKLTALHQAIRRDNALPNIELLLDYNADPLIKDGNLNLTSIQMAARRGRGDALQLFERKGFDSQLEGSDQILALAALGRCEEALAVASDDAESLKTILEFGGQYIVEFAGNGNAEGIDVLLKLGIPIDAKFAIGDGYFALAPNSTALHNAAWRARHDCVRFLIEHGADVNALNGAGRTPLDLAVSACVDSWWQQRRKPDSIAALLKAGAKLSSYIKLPTGYAEADELLMNQQEIRTSSE